MQTHLLSEGIVPARGSNAVAAGTTAINGASIDLQTLGAIGAMAIACLGTLTATQVTKLKWQGSDDNSTWADLTHTDSETAQTTVQTAAAADADSNKMLCLDVLRPGHRYIRAVVVRGTANAVLDSLVYIPYHLRAMPAPAYGSTVSQSAAFIDAV